MLVENNMTILAAIEIHFQKAFFIIFIQTFALHLN